MRSSKIKTFNNLRGSLKHCFREQETQNANEEKTPENLHFKTKNVSDSILAFQKRLPEKRRKNAVIAVEYLMTASPEWWEQANEEQKTDFQKSSMKWLEAQYGQENIIVASLHVDEKTPHISAYITPITEDGRLCAKDFLGGREKMRAQQSSFSSAVAHLGLERGIEGSTAKHTKVKQWYTDIQKESTNYYPDRESVEVPAPTAGFALAGIRFAPEKSLQAAANEVERKIYDSFEEKHRELHAKAHALTEYELYKKRAEKEKQKLRDKIISMEQATEEALIHMAKGKQQEAWLALINNLPIEIKKEILRLTQPEQSEQPKKRKEREIL